MQTELYKVFYTVATLGNITLAAQALFISQPAISKSIKHLEQQLNCTLFIRHPKGVRLTTEGSLLLDYVKKAFEALAEGEMILDRIKNLNHGIVRIGISNVLCKYFFTPYLRTFHQLYPHIQIRIFNRSSTETLELLKKGAIDFGIVSMPQLPAEIDFIHLVHIQDIFVTNKKELSNRALPLKDLVHHPLIMLEKSNTTRIFLDQFFAENGVYLTPELEISSMEFLIDFATIGLGIATVIESFVSTELKEGTLYRIPVEPTIPKRSIGIVYQNALPQSVAMKAFIHHLQY